MSSSINISEESFYQLIENVRDYAFIVLDIDGYIMSWNKGAEQIKGYGADEIIGKHMSVFYTNEEIKNKEPQKNLKKTTELGRYENEGWRIRKDGSKFWADVIFTSLYNKDGSIRGYLKITRDITLQREKVEEVKANNYFLNTILENIPNMVFVKDVSDLRFVRFNKAGEKLLGYKKEDLIGKNDYDFFPKEQADFFIKKDKEVIDKGDVYDIQEEPIDTAHGKRWLHTKKIPVMNEEGKPIYLLGISEDITERKSAEEQIIQLNIELEKKIAELEQSNKELESFSYSVSHDLRTPLRAIHSYTHILSENYLNSMNEDGQRMMKAVISNARKMGQLIDDLLTFARIGKKELQKARINIHNLVVETVEEVKKSVTNFKHDITILTLEPGYGDQSLIHQVYINLISNAIKYSQPKEKPKVEIGSYVKDSEVIYYISDNGVGFDMRYYSKLFGVFQRLHSMEEFEGTGVGLALVNRIIYRHGGRVWAEGKPGEGATFYFTLGEAQNEKNNT